MNAYLPRDIGVAAVAFASLLVVLLLGYGVSRCRNIVLARLSAWSLVVGGVGGMEWFTVSQPAGFRMLAIIGVLLYTMKAVVVVESRASGKGALSFRQWICFACLWVGMRPALAAVSQNTNSLVADLGEVGIFFVVNLGTHDSISFFLKRFSDSE